MKSRCYPFVGKFADVSNVMHCGLFDLAADAAGFAKLGARSHTHRGLDEVNVRVLSTLKGIPSFDPILIEVEADLAVFFSPFALDDNRKSLAKAFEDLGHGDLILARQRLGQ